MYQIEINKLPYSVKLGCITGEELRKMGNIPSNHVLRFAIPGHWSLVIIRNADYIDLTRPGTEQFLSAMIE
jgi:hypothetical protein